MLVGMGAFLGLGVSSRALIDPAECMDYYRRDCSRNIRWRAGRAYYVKPAPDADRARLERLGYLLARDLFNVPEVLPADVAGEGQPHESWVRLCQDCDRGALPVQDLTRAIASEIVFSAWISRRDAHNSNRCYLHGLPMFFDFGAAFEMRQPVPDFFRAGPFSGAVPNWRLVELPPGTVLKTAVIRECERGKPLTLQPVHSADRFWSAADEFSEVISRYRDARIESAILASGFEARSTERLVDLLVRNRRGLGERLRRIRSLMTEIDPSAIPGLAVAGPKAIAERAIRS
jgi:hypothetical protein